MKVIEDKFNEQSDYNIECTVCGSNLLVSNDDLLVGYLGLKYVVCPCCNEQTYNEEFDDIELNKDNLSFPIHYYKINKDSRAIDLENEEINQMVRKCIDSIQNSPLIKDIEGETHHEKQYSYLATGNTFVIVFNHYGDEEYLIVVAKDYYETYIPIEY